MVIFLAKNRGSGVAGGSEAKGGDGDGDGNGGRGKWEGVVYLRWSNISRSVA